MQGGALTLVSFDDGSGQKLYAAGSLHPPGIANNWPVLTWDGQAWRMLDRGLGLPSTGIARVINDGFADKLFAWVNDYSVYPWVKRQKVWAPPIWVDSDPAFFGKRHGPLVSFRRGDQVEVYGYVYGHVSSYNYGAEYPRLAQWDGTRWQVMGDQTAFAEPQVGSLIMYARNGEPRLHVVRSNAYPVSQFVCWDGSAWVLLGPKPVSLVRAAAVFDSGSGPELYYGGDPINGTVGLGPLVKWDGQSWTSAGIGWWGPFSGYQVNALEVFDDGTGPALYAAGAFGSAGGVPAANIARWDGHRWSALGPGITGYVYDMAVYDDGRGESLLVAGIDIRVRSYPGQSMNRPVVQWVGCKGQCYPDCDNDGVLTAADLSCFQNEYARSNPYADCNRDVAFTVADYSCFLEKFTAGCR